MGVAALVTAGALLTLAPAPADAAAKVRVCGRGLDPGGATVLTVGARCSTALSVYHAFGARIQTRSLPFVVTATGRRWTCRDRDDDGRAAVCTRRGAKVTIRLDS